VPFCGLHHRELRHSPDRFICAAFLFPVFEAERRAIAVLVDEVDAGVFLQPDESLQRLGWPDAEAGSECL
jgi:hypothetical protein